MISRSQDRLKAGLLHHPGDLRGIRGNDQAIANAKLGDATGDDDDEGFAGQRQ